MQKFNEVVIDDVQEPQLEPEELEKENNMYDIVGMVGDQYIVKTDKGLNFSLYLIVILKDLTPFFLIDGPLFACFEALLVFYHCLLTTLSDYRSSRPMHCTLVEKYQ